ncbi:hypothetical protein [Sorangium cellulosum]|nr:hypothetical protein [Sorangium cellulosum]
MCQDITRFRRRPSTDAVGEYDAQLTDPPWAAHGSSFAAETGAPVHTGGAPFGPRRAAVVGVYLTVEVS